MTKVKLELLTDIHMSLMVESEIRGEIDHSGFRHAKANNKYMKKKKKNQNKSLS